MEQAAGDLVGEVAIAKINVDENRALAQEYQIRSLPTILVIKDRKVLGSIRPRSAEALVAEVRETL